MQIAAHIAVFVGALTLSASSALAAFDHLACYKVRDTGVAKHDFEGVIINSGSGLISRSGCVVRTPAKLCCDSVDKIGVPPQPGGGGPTSPTTRFCCCKVKCPKLPASQFDNFQDQFGSRGVELKTMQLVCAPASPSGAFLDNATF